MLYQLLLFKAKHGHCRVPGSKGALGSWVVSQRQQYHALKAKQAQGESKPAAAAMPAPEGDQAAADGDKAEDIKPRAETEDGKRKSQSLNEERIAVLNTM